MNSMPRHLAQITRERTGKIEYMVEAKVDNGNEFATLLDHLDSNIKTALAQAANPGHFLQSPSRN